MSTDQSPYGGGGFTPAWLSSTREEPEQVEWDTSESTQEPVGDSDGPVGAEQSWDFSAPTGEPDATSGSEEQLVTDALGEDDLDQRAPFDPVGLFTSPAAPEPDFIPEAEGDPAVGVEPEGEGRGWVPDEEEEEAPRANFDTLLSTFSGAPASPASAAPEPDVAPDYQTRQEARAAAKTPPKPKRTRPARTPRPRGGSSSTSGHGGRKRAVMALLLALAVVAVLALGYAGYTALTGASEDSAAAPAAPQVSREVPPGWTASAAWTAPADVASNLAVRGDHVAYLNSAGVLVVMDGADGQTVFSSTPTGADPQDAKVALTTVGGKPVVVVVKSDAVTAWDLSKENPESKTNNIPSSASVTTSPAGVMVNVDAETWRLEPSLGLKKVQGLAKGNTSLGLTKDGAVVSGSAKGGWSINDGSKSRAVKVEMAEQAKGKVMYPVRASKGYVVAWAPTEDKGTRSVGMYEATTGKVVASTTMPTSTVNLGLPLTVTDGGALAAAGSWLVDLGRGETETVDGWDTSVGVPGALYGTVEGSKMVWSGSGSPVQVSEGSAVPWGVTHDHAVIISEEDGKTMVAALNREG